MNVVSAMRAVLGLTELTAPAEVATRIYATPMAPVEQMTVRVLGGRQLMQAALSTGSPGHRTLALGAVVDGLHAASMVALAALSPRLRRAAATEAATAAAFALAGAVRVRNSRRNADPPSPESV